MYKVKDLVPLCLAKHGSLEGLKAAKVSLLEIVFRSRHGSHGAGRSAMILLASLAPF